ncbi:hypothetical protein QBC39DRAFT_435392 [Podospora conica]|nr:hypothetical protein QBC39DRAFT_435392 [Schizothecium conicum]
MALMANEDGTQESSLGSGAGDDTLPKMGPLAVLQNPLAKDKFLVFSSSPQRTVTVEHRKWDGPTGITISPNAGHEFSPLLAYPSSLTALVLEDTICAFGIVGDEGDYKLALVSPGPQTAPQLSPTTTSLAGFSTSKADQAYLYFQGTDKGVPVLREWVCRLSNFTKPSASPIDKSLPNFLPGTKLAAATDNRGNRWLVYQAKDSTVCVYNVKTRANVRIETTNPLVDSVKPTYLGVSVAPADKATGRTARVYVYYVGSDGTVHVIDGEVSEKDQLLSFAVKAKPGPTFDVQSGESTVAKPEEWSQIAVVPWLSRTVPDPDNEGQTLPKPANVLFYFDGDSLRQIECDEWK